VNWGVNVTPVTAVDLTLDVKHMGDVMGNEDNSFRLDGYTLVDVAATWRRGPLRITLSAHNLFDEEYYWNGDGESADPGAPRTVLLSTSIRFR
jgi:outer membrane receptor protein involved in Fe transport